MRGISGSLIPRSFLEDWLRNEAASSHSDRDERDGVAQLVRWWRRNGRQLGPSAGARHVLDVAVLPLISTLGYEPLHIEKHDDGFVGVIGVAGRSVAALVVLPWIADPAEGWRDAVRAGRTAAAPWGLICTGRSLRLIDAGRPWARRALDFEFEEALASETSAQTLWRLTRVRTLDERESGSELRTLVAQADAHGVSVCTSLGDGVLDALTCLLGALDVTQQRLCGATDARPSVFEQALTVVYRLLFLLFAEAHAVVPTWHRIYGDAYTIGSLCRGDHRRSRRSGLWEAVQAISRLAHAGCRAGDLHVTAFNGRLFSPRHAPLAERARVSNAVIERALKALVWGPGVAGRRPIAYADLGVEQLGAVYERVLEYEPAAQRGPAVLTRTSQERKSTGSFYTPRSITEFLVRRTLHPLIDGRTADHILNLRIVDPAMGSGAFLVAACRYLAVAVERARIRDGEWRDGDVTAAQRAEVRRLLAQRCLYGVDANPMAVQLARLSMWLTTLAAERPLTFLDHHLVCGDSLIGASLHDLARGAPGRRTRPVPLESMPLFDEVIDETMARSVLPDRYRLARGQENTAQQVRAKERALAELNRQGAPLTRWKRAADVWCAAWFWPGEPLTSREFSDLLCAALDRQPLMSRASVQDLLTQATAVARATRAFHWELEFPEVFFDHNGQRLPDGGFDAVITNPPWDVLRADAGNAATRSTERKAATARVRFFRDAGVYRMHGSGHANRYQLFVERVLQLARPGSRIGLILPSGFATDHGSSTLRRAVLDRAGIDRLIGFHNSEAIFPIHRDVRFLLLTATTGERTERLACRFGATQAAWLDTLPDAVREDPPDARTIRLSRTMIDAWDPAHGTIPELASATDLGILVQIARTIPALADGRSWGVRFGRELNASDDRRHFVARNLSVRDHLPILEGKHLEPFRALTDGVPLAIPLSRARTLMDEAATFGRLRIGYREVASATNKLTLIAALLPPRAISTHTVFVLKSALSRADQYCLLALLNSLVANYLVRLQVTTHVTAGLMARLPVPRPPQSSPARRELIALAKELERTGITNEPAYARLNALAASLYGLTREHYLHIVGTFPLLSEQLRAACVAAFKKATQTRRHGG